MYLYGTPSASRLGAYPRRLSGLNLRRRRLSGVIDDLTDFYYNVQGDVSPDQKQQLIQSETAGLVQAGMNPTTAASQAQSDVTTTLNTFYGSGAFGIPWTGANPGQTLPSAAASSLESMPSWAWWAIGGAGVLFLVLLVRR